MATALLLCLGIGSLAASTSITSSKEEAIKASYLYNFAKFVRWPSASPQPADNGFHICVKGVNPLSGNIRLLENRLINGLKIVVDNNVSDELKSCSILFIGDSEQARFKQILMQAANLPILTVSDIPNFANAGGIIGMKVADNRVRFDINLAAAQKNGLTIDSQLLKLAMEVIR